MATPETRADDTKTQKGVFYGYNYYVDANDRFIGEERAGSNSYMVFASKDAFEEAVSAYNVLGRTPVRSMATGPVKG